MVFQGAVVYLASDLADDVRIAMLTVDGGWMGRRSLGRLSDYGART